MNGRNIKTKLLKRGERTHSAAAVVAALLFLVAAAVGAQGQTVTGSSFRVNSQNAVVGLVPGQTLRVSVPGLEQPEEDSADGPQRVKLVARAKVFDGRGGVIYQTPEADIPAGGFHSFDINRADIAVAGEPRTGRLQVRVEIVISAAPARDEAGGTRARVDKLPRATLELVDNDSGKTTAMLLPAVQAAREAARR